MQLINDFIQQIAKLPSLGPRSAQRIALYILSNPETVLHNLQQMTSRLKETVETCTICGNIDTQNPCHICTDTHRDSTVLCIVEQISDVWALEKTHSYRGYYHILGGTISAEKGMDPDKLRIHSLIQRVKDSTTLQEIIVALSPTFEGQATLHYIIDLLHTHPVKLTRPAFGLPLGSNFDYLDSGTIEASFHKRTEIND